MAMDDKEQQTAFMSALVTEHFVLQTAASATVNEAGARTSLYAPNSPSVWSGSLVAFLTTAATMIAFINGIVAGAGVTLLAANLLGGNQLGLAISLGVGVSVALMAAFLAYQWRRYRAEAATS